MSKQSWKPGNMLNPVPAVMVTVADESGNKNIITIAWAGTVCTNPPMVSISVRPERYSYEMIEKTGEFVINLTTEELVQICEVAKEYLWRDFDYVYFENGYIVLMMLFITLGLNFQIFTAFIYAVVCSAFYF